MPVRYAFKNMLRATCLTIGLALLSSYGLSAQEAPVFEVASIKPSQAPAQARGIFGAREDINTDPGRLTMMNVTLNTATRWAYKLGVFEISGPEWMLTTRFDISAKAPAPVAEEQLRLMLQSMLKERFKIEVHRESRQLSGYALVVGKNGTKLKPVEGGGEGSMTGAALTFEGHRMPLSRLADIISSALKTPVRDMTKLEGFYDFKVDLRPYLTGLQPGEQLDLVSIATTALDAELGLRLESRKFPTDVLVVDRAEKTPTEN
jgi:uncharacterized protein (TIGR03435 family)